MAHPLNFYIFHPIFALSLFFVFNFSEDPPLWNQKRLNTSTHFFVTSKPKIHKSSYVKELRRVKLISLKAIAPMLLTGESVISGSKKNREKKKIKRNTKSCIFIYSIKSQGQLRRDGNQGEDPDP